MLGKPEWFKRRKYTGWGITPKTWQGWVYVIVICLPFVLFQSLTYWSEKTRIIVTVCWLAVILFDVLDIMMHLKNDEREKIHEAIAERNAAWFMSIVLAIGIVAEMIYFAYSNQEVRINIVVMAALFGGVLVKMISNIYLDRKN